MAKGKKGYSKKSANGGKMGGLKGMTSKKAHYAGNVKGCSAKTFC